MDREPHESYIFYGGPVTGECSEERETSRRSEGAFDARTGNKKAPKRKERVRIVIDWRFLVPSLFIGLFVSALNEAIGLGGAVVGLVLALCGYLIPRHI